MRRLLSIERIAGETALCEDDEGKRVRLPRASLPDGAGEGDLLRPVPGGWEIDREETARRRGAAAERLSRMSARTRRTNLERALRLASEPVSASTLAERFHVSRQIIVGDIALLRAGGAPVVATPRGYLLEGRGEAPERLYTIACRHTTPESLLQELYLAVDQGAAVVDVTVEHPVYGQLTGQLEVRSRYDADRFVQTLAESDAAPLSMLTGGIHLHTLRCPDRDCFERVCAALRKAEILVEEL